MTIRILTDKKFTDRVHSDEGFLGLPCTFHVYTVVTGRNGKVSRTYNPSAAPTAEEAANDIAHGLQVEQPSATVEIYGVAPVAR